MAAIPPDLEKRFMPPENWQWSAFERITGRKIRYGWDIPENCDTVIIYLPGLAEPAEKAFEIAQDVIKRGYGFAVMDWFGQGGSERYLENPHKRHAASFGEDLADFHAFLAKLETHTKDKRMIMLAHSMGGNLGLRYMHDHPEIFSKAAFTSPMIGIYAINTLPDMAKSYVSKFMNNIAGTQYVVGGSDWHESKLKEEIDKKVLSSDPLRAKLQNKWFKAKPELAVGDVTYGWVYEAWQSCLALRKQLPDIHTPVLMGMAEHDYLVDNVAIKHAVEIMPHADLLELPDSRHEILMERDEIRNKFFDAFYNLI